MGSIGNSGLVSKDNYGTINVVYTSPTRELEQLSENSSQSDFSCSGQSPYRGLSPFLEEDAALFFGRAEKIESLYNLVQINPLTAVIGASGSGKSSLVYAGLLPRLRQKAWLIGSFRPKLQPFAELATALVKLLEPELDDIHEINQAALLAKTLKEENGFYQAVSRLLDKYPNQQFILFVDQFEELFKASETERKEFIDCLLNTLDKTPELKLVLTLRADCCEQAYAYPLLLDKLQKIELGILQAADLKLGSMSKLELQEAIECPVENKATFQPGLVKQILEDLGTVSGNLPLLEFALNELWKQGTLTLDAYRKIGGVREALAKRADAIYEEYERKDKGKQVEKLFRQLVAISEDTSDTRRIVTQSQIKDWNLVEELATKRLLVIGQDEKSKERTVELIHEALIQEWEKLREWVSDKRENSIKFQRIEGAAKEWEKNKNALSDLWQGRRLKDAIQLLQKQDEIEPISPLAKSFIKKSETSRNSKLIRNFLVGSASVSFMVCITGYFFIQENNRKLKLAALRGETSSEILKAIPDWLWEAESKQKEGKAVEALTIARENARIMENWRNATVTNPGQYDQFSIRKFSQQALDRQVSVIQQYSLPRLKKELTKKPNAMIGKVQSTDPSKSCDQQYMEGALRTTCNIIFQDLGAATDLWFNSQVESHAIPNRIATQEQAARIPCPVVVLIEELWRNSTKKNCGWLGSPGNELVESNCKELDGKSLTDQIFPDPIYAPMMHLKECSVPLGKTVKQSQNPSKIVTPSARK